jgi:hypothetical protein
MQTTVPLAIQISAVRLSIQARFYERYLEYHINLETG